MSSSKLATKQSVNSWIWDFYQRHKRATCSSLFTYRSILSMHPTTDDLQDWECCGKNPRQVPAKQHKMRKWASLFSLVHFSVTVFLFVLVWLWRVLWIEIDHSMLVDHFHSVALVATGCFLSNLWVTGFSGVFHPPGTIQRQFQPSCHVQGSAEEE